MKTDSRIIPTEKIDVNRTVLVDAHSLKTIPKYLIDDNVPSFEISEFTEYGAPSLSNIIQNIILYDKIIVDSILFQINSDLSIACELFPDTIFGVYLRPMVRSKIGTIVQNIARMEWGQPNWFPKEDWIFWQIQESSEIQLMDKLDSVVPDLIPREYEHDEEILSFIEKGIEGDMPLCCTNSLMSLGRAHYYLELSRELGVPLSADPIRSKYFEILLESIKDPISKGTPEVIIAYFENTVFDEVKKQLKNIISLDFSIPAVTELAVNYAKIKKCSLKNAVVEIRNSKNAINFREWCSRLFSLDRSGRYAIIEQKEMFKELGNACEIWKNDVRNFVDYKVRKLSFEKIPMAGEILKAFNMQQIEVKDPVIMGKIKKHSYFLFLNDLLRKPN